MKIQKKQAFTLVELIVVITILAILGTIAFISLQGYSKSARDSVRTTDLKNIEKGLELTVTKDSKVPMPENYVEVSMSGTTIGYEGDMGLTSLGNIGVSEARDPLDKEFYTYFVSANLTKYQIMGYLEDTSYLSFVSKDSFAAADYTTRLPYVKGDSLGLLIDENNVAINRLTNLAVSGKFDMLGDEKARVIQPLFDNSDHMKEEAFRWGGQLLTASQNQDFGAPSSCPTNFIPVPGNTELGQPGFCIGKYEASVEGATDTSGIGTYSVLAEIKTFITKQNYIPISNILYTNSSSSIFRCESNGNGYHMMTLNEWLTIARNIEGQGSNWSSGTPGEGNIKTGNSGNPTGSGFSNGSVLLSGTDGDSSHDNLRKLTLSNGEEIWDFIGNVWEIVRPLNFIDNSINDFLSFGNNINVNVGTPSYEDLNSISDVNYNKYYGPQITNNASQGMGTLRNLANGYIIVGGDYNSGVGFNENGLYSILQNSSTNNNNVGTRCAFISN